MSDGKEERALFSRVTWKGCSEKMFEPRLEKWEGVNHVKFWWKNIKEEGTARVNTPRQK